MSEGVDLEVFRDIPGYKGILKAVLKSQIQLLLHQLAQLAGEETVLLSASVSDGTFGYLGSDFGKDFIKGNDEYKAKFLCFCMEKHHKRKTAGKPRSFAERFASHMQRSKGFHAARKFASSTPKSSSVKYQSLLNTGSKGKKRQAEGNPSSEVGSKKEKTLDESGTGTPNGQQIGVPLHSELDPDNSMDYSKIIVKQEQSRDDPEDTDTAEGHKTGEDDEDIPGQMQSADILHSTLTMRATRTTGFENIELESAQELLNDDVCIIENDTDVPGAYDDHSYSLADVELIDIGDSVDDNEAEQIFTYSDNTQSNSTFQIYLNESNTEERLPVMYEANESESNVLQDSASELTAVKQPSSSGATGGSTSASVLEQAITEVKSGRMNRLAAAKHFGIPKSSFYLTIDKYGNRYRDLEKMHFSSSSNS